MVERFNIHIASHHAFGALGRQLQLEAKAFEDMERAGVERGRRWDDQIRAFGDKNAVDDLTFPGRAHVIAPATVDTLRAAGDEGSTRRIVSAAKTTAIALPPHVLWLLFVFIAKPRTKRP